MTPRGRGRFRLRLVASDPDGTTLAVARLDGVDGAALTGGIALVSSSKEADGGTRHWFAGLGTAGAKVARQPERAEGPVLGTLYTLNGPVLKLTAQLFPVGAGDPRELRLQTRRPGGAWEDAGVAPVGPGFAAAFRVTGWDGAAARDYRVLWGAGTAEEQAFEGTVAADPAGDDELRVGLLDCAIHSYRPLNVGSDPHDRLPGSDPLGLYTGRNLYFPYAELAAEVGRRRPHLLAAVGDQYYEHRPTTREQGPEPVLDVLYRWYLWLWSFRDLTRSVSTVVLVDDHDVYHPNLWGNAGAPARGATTARAATGTRPPGSTWSSGSRRAITPTPTTPPPWPRASASTTAPSATAGSGSPWSRTASSRTATRTTATRPGGATT